VTSLSARTATRSPGHDPRGRFLRRQAALQAARAALADAEKRLAKSSKAAAAATAAIHLEFRPAVCLYRPGDSVRVGIEETVGDAVGPAAARSAAAPPTSKAGAGNVGRRGGGGTRNPASAARVKMSATA
jgi:hypothetical protein